MLAEALAYGSLESSSLLEPAFHMPSGEDWTYPSNKEKYLSQLPEDVAL